MSLRNVLLAIGAVCVFAGIGLLISWFGQVRNPPAAVETAVESPVAILVAARAIPAGKSLEKDDFRPKNVGPGEVLPVNLRPGQETEYLGARSQRKFDEGEPLIASEFVKPETLAAKLKPGSRAISIFVDAVQSASGLALPGDHVDVILTQVFDDKITTDPGRKTVGETVLRDVRVIAIDQSMNPQPNTSTVLNAVSAEPRTPKMVTLELGERQAEVLLVAAQLGKFQLAVRPIAAAGAVRPEDKRNSKPVWASDVSPALDELEPLQPRQVSVRVYSGQPKSDGYLCSRIVCVPSEMNTGAPEGARQTNQTPVIPGRY
ncbi:MAG: Flp pilus assembly protein CpaB [Methylocella sp.]